MIHKPAYFKKIRARAADQWDKLEKDPELAGPWHQLFKQVQNPRHVVSELLQNADDAGASEAAIEIRNGEFIFSHNGEDFIEEHFASLCRFGYSNKRVLHTIGFRGIGFKSTFSLGDNVRISTPTLSTGFNRKRFTQPFWIERGANNTSLTEISVVIKDQLRAKEINKNLDEWQESAAALLFFRSIRCLRIMDREVRWISQGSGPVADSEWVALSSAPGKKYLLIRSEAEAFPNEALEEIKQERMLSIEEKTIFPPCQIEIVLGMEGGLFMILPTGVKTNLPFACNAPFIQDPARTKIKDPNLSATNRWLLARVGRLAAKTMLAWLKRDDYSIESRCEAYKIFTDVDREDSSLGGYCATLVEEAFGESIENESILLSDEGKLVGRNKCVAVPGPLFEVWPSGKLATLFAGGKLEILNRYMDERDKQKLVNWEYIEKLEKQEILSILDTNSPPLPDSWHNLMILWNYLYYDVAKYYYRYSHKHVRIVPVRGKKVLYAASEVVRLGEKKLLRSEEDWQFLDDYLLIINQKWLKFISDHKKRAEERNDRRTAEQADAAISILDELGLNSATDASFVMERVASEFFSRKDISIEDSVRIAQIAAKLNVRITKTFRFYTRAGLCQPIDYQIIADLKNDLDIYIDPEWYDQHTLHLGYFKDCLSCSEVEWREWVSSDKSGLWGFPPLEKKETSLYHRGPTLGLFGGYGGSRSFSKPYVSDKYILKDWDFSKVHWAHWKQLASNDDSFWGKIFKKIMDQPKSLWEDSLEAIGYQICSRGQGAGNRSRVASDMVPKWIQQFRNLPCIQDTWGHYRQPTEVLRRTPATEALLDVEPFIRAEYDSEATRPLLIALGLRDTPTGPERILERLSALSRIPNSPITEIEKWYSRLDNLAEKCSTDELEKIRRGFNQQSLILAEDNSWKTSSEIFLSPSEEDIPGSLFVHPSARHLSLWQRIGVAERPTPDLAIAWLKTLRSDEPLAQDVVGRVLSLSHRYPARVWNECGHWPSINGEWVHVSKLQYALRAPLTSLLESLFPSTKQRTANLESIPDEICQKPPFSKLRDLAAIVEERFHGNPIPLSQPAQKAWLNALGSGLKRIALDDMHEANLIHSQGDRLSQTSWQVLEAIETVPYIDGVPVGVPRCLDTLWKDSVLYVKEGSSAKLAKIVAREIGQVFGTREIIDTIFICYDRSEEFIKDYLEENYHLMEPENAICYLPENSGTTQAKQTSLNSDDRVELTAGAPRLSSEYKSAQIIPQENKEGLLKNGAGLTREYEPLQDDAGTKHEPEQQGEDAPQARERRSHEEKQSLIERFAQSKGFIRQNESRFRHPAGNLIKKAGSNIFTWEQWGPSGNLIRSYWVQNLCLQKKPLQLDTEVWEMLTNYPDTHSVILRDLDDAPIEITGSRLKEMLDKRELTLYPSTYRLVYTHEHNS